MEVIRNYCGLYIIANRLRQRPPTPYHLRPRLTALRWRAGFRHRDRIRHRLPHSRHSGAPNNRAAAEWLFDQFSALGLDCELQEWTAVNYSVPTDFRNVVCTLSGEDSRQVLIVAHHDQAPTTIQGADNDGSGISILLQLAEIFVNEGTPAYTLTFVATDGEEYGMLGTAHYVRTHPNPEDILVGMSLDNLGREYYDAMNIELIGQYRNYGPIWVPLTLQAAAEAAGGWQVNLRAPLDQMLDQAGPISFMDQGPMIAAGIPAVGLTGHVPAEFGELQYRLWHDPDDTMEHQSAETLGAAGRVAEAFVRQLLATEEFPRGMGPYIYFEKSNQSLQGWPLWALFVAFVALFFLASFLTLPRGSWREAFESRRRAAPHFLSLWLPLLASIVLTYVLVAVGMMDKYAAYPATSKDVHIYNPRWEAVIIFLGGLAVFLWLGRLLSSRLPLRASAAKRGNPQDNAPTFLDRKSLAFGVIGVGAVYVLFISPFSLLFFVPLLFWLLISPLRGATAKRQSLSRASRLEPALSGANGATRESNPLARKAMNIALFLLGGLVFYGLFYFFGFVIYDYGFRLRLVYADDVLHPDDQLLVRGGDHRCSRRGVKLGGGAIFPRPSRPAPCPLIISPLTLSQSPTSPRRHVISPPLRATPH
ncbi:MAG: M28 family metallopeptidase [Chloroflexi bacterium]|nr:M28 family metallopeptidase [Chloroflexota bacterium]